jgi:hypothetical protein
MSAALIARKVARLFPDPLQRAEVEGLLDGVGEDRVKLAILKLSGGDIEALGEAAAAAALDWRDVIAWAEYPEQMRAGHGGVAPECAEGRAMRRRDERQLRRWLEEDREPE